MNRFLILLLFLGINLRTVDSARAAVVERDWQSPGDGLLTYDVVNQREWLDLSETILDQFPGPGPQTTEYFEARYQAVVAELAPGGRFAGFSVANSVDGTALAESAGIDTTTDDFETNRNATEGLINLLGVTEFAPMSRLFTYGFIDEADFSLPPSVIRDAMIVDFDPPVPLDNGGAQVVFGRNDGMDIDNVGVMLYRQAIPEPSSIILFTTFVFLHSGIHSHLYLRGGMR